MQAKGEEAMALFQKGDAAKALALVEEIPPRFRASLLALGSSKVSKENTALGQTLLEKCATLLSEIKDPGDRVLPWAKIAEAAHTLNNDKFALEALQHALSDIGEVYAWDTDA